VQVENEIYVLNEDLEDMGTSLIGLAETVATEEHHMVGNDVLPTNPALPSPNSALFKLVKIEFLSIAMCFLVE
jgi:hypothetical protein